MTSDSSTHQPREFWYVTVPFRSGARCSMCYPTEALANESRTRLIEDDRQRTTSLIDPDLVIVFRDDTGTGKLPVSTAE